MIETNLGGIPEKFKEEGVLVHYGEKARVGDTLEAIKNIRGGEIPKGTIVTVSDLIIEPKGNVRGFSKKLKLDGFSGDYNPKKFKRVYD